jgi:two-component system, OmpR family, phosphate regulon sensor histidine kinase PhoR
MKRIQSKITFTYVVLTFVVIAAVGGLFSAKMESYFKDGQVLELSGRADLMASLLRKQSASSPEEADRFLKELSRATNLRITLIDSSGVVLMDSDIPLGEIPSIENHLRRPELQSAIRHGLGTDTRHSTTVGKEFLYVAKQLDVSTATGLLAHVRFLRLSEHLEDIQAAVSEIRWSMFGVGCVVLVLVAGVSMFVSRRLARPMVTIAQRVEEIRTGNLDTRIEVHGNDEIGQVARAINEMVDQLKLDIAQLRKLERVRSEFLGNVSHELRTPIFSLQGFLETLLNGAVDDPAVNKVFLQKAYSHAERLNTLLGDLINISQIESGEMKLSFRYFRVKEFLGAVVSDFQPVAERHQVHLSVNSQLSSDVDVFGDKERLLVALGNLIENAIKYNKPGGDVVVSSVPDVGRIRITVSDTGVGVAQEHLPRIFERFYRVDKNRSRDVGGTGLGLAIAKHIVEAHGSSVHVESEVGKGSTFSFTLKM